MFVNTETLQYYGANEYLHDYILNHYPNGVEFIDLLSDPDIDQSALDWMGLKFSLTEDEIAAYHHHFKITASVGTVNSYDINNSFIVRDSNQINDSAHIYRSEQVDKSVHILNSRCVDNSRDVHLGTFISDSNHIAVCTNVSDSAEIYKSNYVMGSRFVYQSENVVNSDAIEISKDITNCRFCTACRNLADSLFCSQQDGGDHLLFNKPIDDVRLQAIIKQYNKFLPPLIMCRGWDHPFDGTPSIINNFQTHFSLIPDQFWQWVESLPGYDPMIMYAITFNPRFLSQIQK